MTTEVSLLSAVCDAALGWLSDEILNGVGAAEVAAAGGETPRTLADWMAALEPVTFNPLVVDGLFDIDAGSLRLSSSSHGGPQILLRNTDGVTPDGAGGFIRFESLSSTGVLRDGLQMNGGLVNATNGAEDGLFDITSYRDGTPAVCFTIDSELESVFPGAESGVYGLGRAESRWKNLLVVEGFNATNTAGDAEGRLIGSTAAMVVFQDTGATAGKQAFRLRDDTGQLVIDNLGDNLLLTSVHTRFYHSGGLGIGSPIGGDPGAGSLNLDTSLFVDGTKVVGAQGAAVADATDASSVITQCNLILARLRAHGLIAT